MKKEEYKAPLVSALLLKSEGMVCASGDAKKVTDALKNGYVYDELGEW